MDSSKKHIKPSPEISANIFSRLFYCWFLPFFKYGYQNNLEIKDIYNATKEDSSALLGDVLERNWNEELLKHNKYNPKDMPSLERVIFKTFYKPYSVYGIGFFLQGIIFRYKKHEDIKVFFHLEALCPRTLIVLDHKRNI